MRVEEQAPRSAAADGSTRTGIDRSRGGWWSIAIPSLGVVAVIVALQSGYGVGVGDSMLFLGFEVGFAIIPGWLLYRALSRRPGGWLRQLALGWGLGYALQVLAFLFTAAVGARDLFLVYPVAIGLPAAVAVVRRPATVVAAERIPADLRWWVGGVCAVAVAYVAFSYFPGVRLPTAGAFRVHQDHAWHLALAGDAKNHWPIEDPNVVGYSMPYHYFVHVHLAAASQVTGLSLPLILFRLYTLPIIVLATIQIVVAGHSLLRSVRAGIVAAVLVLLVGQANLVHLPLGVEFQALLPSYLHTSPSITFGLIMLVPLVLLVGEAISAPPKSTGFGGWVVIALFMIGASDAKVIILPMLGVSLAMVGAAHLVLRRRLVAAVPIAGALALTVFSFVYLVQYRGHSSGMELDPSAASWFFNEAMAAVSVARTYVEDRVSVPGASVLLSAAGVVLGGFGLFAAQLVGIPWVLARQRLRLTTRQAWLLAVLVTGVMVPLLTRAPGTTNQLYFLAYGIVVGCILSADGLRQAWESRPAITGGERPRAWAVVFVGVAILAVATLLPARRWSVADANGPALKVLWAYGCVFASFGVLAVVASRWFRTGRWVAMSVATVLLLAVGAAERPMILARFGVRPIEEVEVGRRVTPELYDAMVWIRENAPRSAVIAVNNEEALEFSYAGFTERRTFFGGWGYSLPLRESGYAALGTAFGVGTAGTAGAELFASRWRLNDQTFRDADRRAVDVLARDYDVRYLLIDEVNGFESDVPGLLEMGELVFEAAGVTVVELPPP